MNTQKEQATRMSIKKIFWYSVYVSCLARVINELILEGGDNLKSTDIPNLIDLQFKFTSRLHAKISKLNSDWEFN
ncbi:hypothetical protein IJ707_00125 [bacterium]|nr:hypothetical protein [bacterium]